MNISDILKCQKIYKIKKYENNVDWSEQIDWSSTYRAGRPTMKSYKLD